MSKKVFSSKLSVGDEIMLIDILQVLLGLIVGLVLGFFLAKHFMMKYLKKNPVSKI